MCLKNKSNKRNGRVITVVVVRISWQAPPPVSLVSDGPLVVNVSKSKRKSHTAINQNCVFVNML